MQTPIFRPAQVSDAAALIALCWPERPADAVIDKLTRQVRSPWAYGCVVVVGAQMMGYGEVARIGGTVELSNLFIAADWRNQGIGTQLIQHLGAYAQRWQPSSITLAVATDNPAARRLYERLGFRVMGQRKTDGGRLWWLRLDDP